MNGISRFSDFGVAVCCCHSGCVGSIGTIIPSQSHSLSDNLNISRLGDIVIFSCGHVGVIITGSHLTITQESQTSRVTDVIVGCPNGFIISGSALCISV